MVIHSGQHEALSQYWPSLINGYYQSCSTIKQQLISPLHSFRDQHRGCFITIGKLMKAHWFLPRIFKQSGHLVGRPIFVSVWRRSKLYIQLFDKLLIQYISPFNFQNKLDKIWFPWIPSLNGIHHMVSPAMKSNPCDTHDIQGSNPAPPTQAPWSSKAPARHPAGGILGVRFSDDSHANFGDFKAATSSA